MDTAGYTASAVEEKVVEERNTPFLKKDTLPERTFKLTLLVSFKGVWEEE